MVTAQSKLLSASIHPHSSRIGSSQEITPHSLPKFQVNSLPRLPQTNVPAYKQRRPEGPQRPWPHPATLAPHVLHVQHMSRLPAGLTMAENMRMQVHPQRYVQVSKADTRHQPCTHTHPAMRTTSGKYPTPDLQCTRIISAVMTVPTPTLQ